VLLRQRSVSFTGARTGVGATARFLAAYCLAAVTSRTGRKSPDPNSAIGLWADATDPWAAIAAMAAQANVRVVTPANASKRFAIESRLDGLT
jgi:hypothetical protein